DENWFPEAFERWRQEGIEVLGFRQLLGNRFNPFKGKVLVNVASGTDWFRTDLTIVYGDQKASLKQIRKAIRNRQRYVTLDDGTEGILPTDWIEKLKAWFEAGETEGDQLLIARSRFNEIRHLFGEELLSVETKAEIRNLSRRFSSLETTEVEVPESLQATLRDYQIQGLKWLNFLDDLNFGGCLADDMGLGKTVQILAFILSQRKKHTFNTNLVVVPTSLLFNWQAEVEKFAPSIRVFLHYGPSRPKSHQHFEEYEIVLTTYGMLLSDIGMLKQFRFNYIFLDESQAIKNPESQRYKAARLLQSRNKIVLTGTPIENNTFDVYGQFSFACPGFLGSKQHFRELYSTPIDKFKDLRRATELQEKIRPFLLRRTKKEVAKELP
ncbi:MAG TPA: SNF2-related protein, partial [Catalimonadaceae bacterium]|nr:SNF2-related protein [Catalimonadaceae bacterium]